MVPYGDWTTEKMRAYLLKEGMSFHILDRNLMCKVLLLHEKAARYDHICELTSKLAGWLKGPNGEE